MKDQETPLHLYGSSILQFGYWAEKNIQGFSLFRSKAQSPIIFFNGIDFLKMPFQLQYGVLLEWVASNGIEIYRNGEKYIVETDDTYGDELNSYIIQKASTRKEALQIALDLYEQSRKK